MLIAEMFVTGGSEGRGATMLRKFTPSRRRLLHGGVGLGSLLLLPRRAVAADAHDQIGGWESACAHACADTSTRWTITRTPRCLPAFNDS